MAIIYTYPRLINLQDQDLLLISDTSSKRKDTMRVELGDIANFVITSKSIITGGGTENYVPIFDVTGSYQLAFLNCAILSLSAVSISVPSLIIDMIHNRFLRRRQLPHCSQITINLFAYCSACAKCMIFWASLRRCRCNG